MKKSLKIMIAVVLIIVLAAGVGMVLLGPWNDNAIDSSDGIESGADNGTDDGVHNENNGVDHVHTWILKTEYKAASCDEDGYAAFLCDCGSEKTEMIEAKGHTLEAWRIEIAADCNHYGKEVADCVICGKRVTATVEKTVHNYEIELSYDEYGSEVNLYTCTFCKDNFYYPAYKEDDIDTVSVRFLPECPENYAFYVYCTEEEAYLRENFCIVEDYYLGTDKGAVEYDLEYHYGGYWRVTPSVPYESGNTYTAVRSGTVFFCDDDSNKLYTGETTFSIQRPESSIAEYRDDILYLQQLEDMVGGYYPYTFEYSEISGMTWLTLGNKKNLEVGNIVCVGNARSSSDLMNSAANENQLGKIASISYLEDEDRYLIGLEPPKLSDVFEKLDIYDPVLDLENEKAKLTDCDTLGVQAKAVLLGSDDFGKFIYAVKETSDTYLMARGLETPLKTIADFIKSIKIDEENSEDVKIKDGVLSAKIVLKGELIIPVTLTDDAESDKVGDITITFIAYVDVQSLTVSLELNDYVDEENGETVKFRVGVDQTVEAGFTFKVAVELDYTLGTTPYLLNTKSGVYHYKDCKHAASIKDKSTLKSLSAEDIFGMLAKDEIDVDKECGTCQPISSMMSEAYVLNYGSKTIHLYSCAHLKTVTSSVLGVSEQPYGNLLLDGYVACKDCSPESRYTNGFSEQLLRKMSYQDLTSGLDEYREALSEIGAGDGSEGRLEVMKIPFSITGVDRIEISLDVYFEFKLEASVEYNFKKLTTAHYGIKLTENGFTEYYSFDEDTLENYLAITGQLRVDTGLAVGVKVFVIGIDKFCYAKIEAEVGIYGKVNGALYVNFLYGSDSYAAAYFESGLHVDVTLTAQFMWNKYPKKSFLPDDKKDIPFIRYGYENIYYNFVNTPDEIEIDSIFYDLDKIGLFEVGYLNLLTMETGTSELNPSGIENKYEIQYALENGNYCTVEDGFILINEYDTSFTDTLIITVVGKDDFGKYRDGNSKYLDASIRITIKYEAEDTVKIPENAFEYNGHYYMIYSAGDMTTPEELRAFCEARGGYLATVGSAGENEFLAGILNNTDFDSIFLGMNRVDGEWRWITGEAVGYMPDCYDNGGNHAMMSKGDMSWRFVNFGEQDNSAFVCEWGAYVIEDEKTLEEKYAALAGLYEGWYTATQGITGIKLDIYRTNALVQDEEALQRLADYATECTLDQETGLAARQFTVDDVRKVIDRQTSEYVAIFMYHPLRQNPDVESGIFVMNVKYDDESGYFKFIQSEWIQHDSYIMADLLHVSLTSDMLKGDVYSETGFIWVYYGYVGEFFVTKGA